LDQGRQRHPDEHDDSEHTKTPPWVGGIGKGLLDGNAGACSDTPD
jgi:hypothetical protein